MASTELVNFAGLSFLCEKLRLESLLIKHEKAVLEDLNRKVYFYSVHYICVNDFFFVQNFTHDPLFLSGHNLESPFYLTCELGIELFKKALTLLSSDDLDQILDFELKKSQGKIKKA